MSAAAPAKVYVVIYTVYHHVHKLAVEVQKGLNSTGVSTKMFQGMYLCVCVCVLHKERGCIQRVLFFFSARNLAR